MKLIRIPLVVSIALLVVGCFSSSPDEGNWIRPAPGPWTGPGPGQTGEALWVDDVAVGPDGTIVTLGSTGAGPAIRILDSNFNVERTIAIDTYGMSVTAPRNGTVLVSDGSWEHVLVDLETGATTNVSGMDAIASYTPAFITGADLDGDGDEETVFSVPCELSGDDPMLGFEGEGADRELSSSLPLGASGMSGVTDITYALDRNTVFALSYEGPIGFDATTGARNYEFENSWELSEVAAWAYDATESRLILVNWNGQFSTLSL